MRIPAGGVGLHKAHAALEQPPRQQQASAEFLGAIVVEPVRLAGGFLFLTEIKNARHFHLHAISQLVAVHARGQLGVARTPGDVVFIELRQKIEVAALLLARDTLGRVQIENRRTLRAQRGALKVRRQKAVGPVRRAALRIGHLGQHDESGQILILRAEPVGDPRANRRIAAEPVAGVHVIIGGGMIDRLGLAPAIHAKLIGHPGEVFPVLAEIHAALPRFAKLERALHVIPFARAHGGEKLARALEFLQVHLA